MSIKPSGLTSRARKTDKTAAVAQCNSLPPKCNPSTAMKDCDESARTAEPEVDEQREDEADQQARGEREMKREILPSPGKITRKTPQPEALSQEEQRPDQKQRAAGDHQELCQGDHVIRSIAKTSARVRPARPVGSVRIWPARISRVRSALCDPHVCGPGPRSPGQSRRREPAGISPRRPATRANSRSAPPRAGATGRVDGTARAPRACAARWPARRGIWASAPKSTRFRPLRQRVRARSRRQACRAQAMP